MGQMHTPLALALTGTTHDSATNRPLNPLVQFPLEHGADPNHIVALWYTTPGYYLCAAAANGFLPDVRVLLQHGAQNARSSVLHAAAQRNDVGVMQILVDHGADINEQLWDNDHMFGSRSRTKKTKRKWGIVSDVSEDRRPVWRGETPLHFSVLFGRVKATRWLVKRGADARVEDEKGWSAEGVAGKLGDGEVLDALDGWVGGWRRRSERRRRVGP